MSFNKTLFFGFRPSKLEHRFHAYSLKSSTLFLSEALLLLIAIRIYHYFASDPTITLFSLLLMILSFFVMLKMQKTVNYTQKRHYILLLNAINILVSKEVFNVSHQNPHILQIWLFFFAISSFKTAKSLLISSFASYVSLFLSSKFEFSGISMPDFQTFFSYFPLVFVLMVSYEKQHREIFISNEKTVNSLKSRAQILDLLPNPVFIVNRSALILFSNASAAQLYEKQPNVKSFFSILSNKDHPVFEEAVEEVSFNEPAISKRMTLFEKRIMEVSFQSIFFENKPNFLLILTEDKALDLMLRNFSLINRTLSKMSSELIEKMELDYNKWSNLQSLKYIKQSDMRLLAYCVMESNYLKCLIDANLDKTKILTHCARVRPKHNMFNLRNTIIQILEIVSVQSIPKHQETSLKFEESFPERVLGDLKRLKHGLLILWRQISLNYGEKTGFEMHCRLKTITKNNEFILVFMIILPENADFFALLKRVSEDEASLSYNIYNHVYDSFDILMFKPIMSLLNAKIDFDEEKRTFSIEVVFEPAGQFEAKNDVLNNRNPFLLTFCRTNPDKNSYKWKEVPFAMASPEKEKLRIMPKKVKKIVCTKEQLKSIPNVGSSSTEENENPLLLHTSSKEISEKASSKEESPADPEPRSRKKTHSCFSKDIVKDITASMQVPPHPHPLEESKAENLVEFTPQNKQPSLDFRIKALIQEDLKDLEKPPKVLLPTPIKRSSIKEFAWGQEEIQVKEKKIGFERGIYESLFKCWKSNEKSLKQMMMASVYQVLENCREQVDIRFQKDKAFEGKKRRQNSLPSIKTSFTSLRYHNNNQVNLHKKYSKTPKFAPSRLKSRILKNPSSTIDFFEDNKRQIEEEKMAFLGSRMVLSPRTNITRKMFHNHLNELMKPLRREKQMNEVLKQRYYTLKRAWIA